jgi:tetratricopeptide (TPR) repeat protein
VRITAQLIDVSSGVHLWSDSYNRDITDIFTVQQEIAERIVNQIGIALPSGKQVLHTSQGTTNPAAYELYLLARHLANTGNPFEVEKAIPLYEQALKLEPGFADAWAELGMTYVMLADLPLALRIPAEINPIAANAFRTALEIDPNHARAMGFLGHLLISHEYQWSEGLRLLSQSVDISPHDATVLALYGHWLNNSDHPDASSTLERAYLLNPFDMTAVFTRATQLAFDGRLVDGTALMETALIQNRERYDANLLAALFNATTLRTDIAETYLTKARNVVGNDYPSVRIIDLLIAQQRGHDELATELKMELLALAQHTRVGLLSFFTIGWNAAQIKQVSDIATDQRHGEVLDWRLRQGHCG